MPNACHIVAPLMTPAPPPCIPKKKHALTCQTGRECASFRCGRMDGWMDTGPTDRQVASVSSLPGPLQLVPQGCDESNVQNRYKTHPPVPTHLISSDPFHSIDFSRRLNHHRPFLVCHLSRLGFCLLHLLYIYLLSALSPRVFFPAPLFVFFFSSFADTRDLSSISRPH
ncbi:hypothetical protein LX32DRAFT_247944 [Colletotrichum zoysiae]|uniref:Uncharacterized protein n=1 Tax=Colletotrichum zoysiae TaxID=1216348 RepID=A0AAD9LTQ2_9PEZI|nr:hypothetical protein LX32DRAFT_247944 [Colletotrichum zoysiae]